MPKKKSAGTNMLKNIDPGIAGSVFCIEHMGNLTGKSLGVAIGMLN